MILGWTKACSHAFREWFKLRTCVKREGKTKTVKVENFRHIGQILGINWYRSAHGKINIFGEYIFQFVSFRMDFESP